MCVLQNQGFRNHTNTQIKTCFQEFVVQITLLKRYPAYKRGKKNGFLREEVWKVFSGE